jgi:hypothetical protein
MFTLDLGFLITSPVLYKGPDEVATADRVGSGITVADPESSEQPAISMQAARTEMRMIKITLDLNIVSCYDYLP